MRFLAPLALPLTILLLFTMPTPTKAQESPSGLQELGFLVGTWTFTYEGSEGQWQCDWFGETFIHCEGWFKDASGTDAGVQDMFSYNAQDEVFDWRRFATSGTPEVAKGQLHPDRWTFVFDEPFGGKTRASFLMDGPDVCTILWEDSVEGGDWEATTELKMTKAG